MTTISITLDGANTALVTVRPTLLGWLLGWRSDEYLALHQGRGEWCRRNHHDQLVRVSGKVERALERAAANAAVRARLAWIERRP